jgi:hypothetical protein
MDIDKITTHLEDAGRYAMTHGSQAVAVWGYGTLLTVALVIGIAAALFVFAVTQKIDTSTYADDGPIILRRIYVACAIVVALIALTFIPEALPRIFAPEGVIIWTLVNSVGG